MLRGQGDQRVVDRDWNPAGWGRARGAGRGVRRLGGQVIGQLREGAILADEGRDDGGGNKEGLGGRPGNLGDDRRGRVSVAFVEGQEETAENSEDGDESEEESASEFEESAHVGDRQVYR